MNVRLLCSSISLWLWHNEDWLPEVNYVVVQMCQLIVLYTVVLYFNGHTFYNENSGLVRGVASLDLLIFNNLCASEIWPDKWHGLRREEPDKRGTTVCFFLYYMRSFYFTNKSFINAECFTVVEDHFILWYLFKNINMSVLC